MNNIKIKKTLNLHRFSVRFNDIFANWKLILPTVISVIGLIMGSYIAKGEGWTYSFAERYINMLIIQKGQTDLISETIVLFLIPSVFAVLLFFCGLSVFGGFVSNTIPFIYSFVIGVISYYMYANYTLKGLAYCVIMIFPYAVLSLFALIIMVSECINMSEYLVCKIGNRTNYDYNYRFYYINFFKSFGFIVIAVLVKCILDSLFIRIFSF